MWWRAGRNVKTSMSVDAVVISYKSLAGGKATVVQYGQGEDIISTPTCLLQKAETQIPDL